MIDIGSLASGAGSIISAVGQNRLGKQAQALEEKNFKWQQEVSNRNYQHTLDTFNYQKNLQQQIFGREDNSVQRRVKDLEAAGINPILAAGQGARAGSAVAVSSPRKDTPQRNFQQSMALKGAALREVADISRTIAETRAINAQAGNLEAKTTGQETQNTIAQATVDSEIARIRNGARISRQDLDRARTENKIAIERLEQAKIGTSIAKLEKQWQYGLDDYITKYHPGVTPGTYNGVWSPRTQEYLSLTYKTEMAKNLAKLSPATQVSKWLSPLIDMIF